MIGLFLATAAAAVQPANPDHAPERIFGRVCSACHGPSGWGTRTLARRMDKDQALLANRRDLAPDFLRAVLRRGIGSMPHFTPTEISDADIDALAAWLAKPHPPSPAPLP